MRRELWLNGMDLSYEWEKKRVKNLNLRVRPDGSIHVSTAGWVPPAAVDDFVRSRADLIQKARLRWQNERPSEAFEVEDGAVLPCMGREMTLTLRRGSLKGAAVQGDRLVLTLPDQTDRKTAERLFAGWWKETCEAVFAAALEKWYPRFARWNIPKPVLRHRRMKSRWGSCQPATAVIMMNERLLHAPPECTEYIMVHELAHLVRADHSPAFHAVVTEVMPDWKVRKKRLQEAKIPL